MAVGFIAVAPKAEAGQYARVYTKHGPVYLHKSQLYGGGCYTSHSKHYKKKHRSYAYYPSYSTRSYRSYPAYRSYPRSYSSGYRCSSRPTISFAFGF